MKKQLLFTQFILLTSYLSFGQTLTSPQAEGIYGGRIHGISGMVLNSDSTRLIISTESANSLFYADVKTSNVASLTHIGSFSPVPGADIDDGFGSSIRHPTFHEASGILFFISHNQLYSIDPASGPATIYSNAEDVLIYGNQLFYVENSNIHFGTLDAFGNYTASTGSPIPFATSVAGRPTLHIDPVTNFIHVFTDGTAPKIHISSTTITTFSSSSVFNSISYTATAGVEYNAYNISPDGTFYMMGNHYPSGSANSDFIEVAYSSTAGINWNSYQITSSGSHVGVIGPNIEFAGNATSYYTYNGGLYNTNNGDSASWQSFGVPGGTYAGYAPNGGVVYHDPNNDSIVYFTTDVALGFSSDYGATTKPLNQGITAVQVYDMDMTSDYSTGWVSSKSGIRKVSNYKVSASWSDTHFPNGDGSPYYSIDMVNDDTNSVYTGNVQVYKTNNSGTNWNLVFDPTHTGIFTQVGTHCRAIEVNPWFTNVVMAGFANEHSGDGGLFISEDAGSTWNQILINASTSGSDVDVYDIIFTDTNTAYVGVGYDLSAPTGRSIYKIEFNPSTSAITVSQDMNGSGTSTGSPITAQIFDLELSPGGDTLFAAGTDAGANHSICYFKNLGGSALWEVINTTGFPTGSNDVASAVTIGDGVVFCAVNSDIYTYDLSVSSGWTPGYSYPIGTKINFLFYDELLVGTGTGLYAQDLKGIMGSTDYMPADSRAVIDLYPNPGHSYIELHLKDPELRITNLKLFNSTGTQIPIITAERGDHHTLLNVIHLTPGVYFIKIEVSGKLYLHQFIRE